MTRTGAAQMDSGPSKLAQNLCPDVIANSNVCEAGVVKMRMKPAVKKVSARIRRSA